MEQYHRKKIVSLWLPVAVLLLGLVFLIFVFIEYQRNTTLIEQNKTLISGSAKTRLINNISNRKVGTNWANHKDNYSWILQAPSTYWFSNGLQEFPWHRATIATSIKPSKWQIIWAELNRPTSSNDNSKHPINKQRLGLLKKIKSAIDDDNQALIKQSFDAYREHLNAYRLGPEQEIAFSLILIEIGAKQHWSPELIHAVLITGGNSETPIIRPVIDILFRNLELFTNDDFHWITNRIKHQLEEFNLSSHFLNDYVLHLEKPQFVLPKNAQSDNKSLTVFKGNHWLLRKKSNIEVIAAPIELNNELKTIESEFIEQGILDKNDSLVLVAISNNTPFNNIQIDVKKAQLNRDHHNQLAYLVIKSLLLISFMALILLSLRLIEKNQKRRLEYLSLREDFVKLVSHELKTPLAGIRAMAETLRKRIERNLSVQTYPERIINEADKLWYMVDNILGFNRVQLSDAIINKQPTNIKSLCDAVINDVQSLSNKPYLVNNSVEENTVALVDSELFSLVIKNIIVNSGLYNEHDNVEIKLIFNKNISSLLITDNGVGIAKADQRKIFEPFVRLNQTRRQSGTGLGLAICKRIMKLHNGDLSLASSSNFGSVWQINIEKPSS